MFGPGHLRSTVLPGQEGTSVILGRAAAYGGPFGDLGHIPIGSTITTTTGVGTVEFKVIDVRQAGSALPPVLQAGQARLTLVSAAGAALSSWRRQGGRRCRGPGRAGVPPGGDDRASGEQPMGAGTGGLFPLVLLLQSLIIVVAGAAWGWFALGAGTDMDHRRAGRDPAGLLHLAPRDVTDPEPHLNGLHVDVLRLSRPSPPAWRRSRLLSPNGRPRDRPGGDGAAPDADPLCGR